MKLIFTDEYAYLLLILLALLFIVYLISRKLAKKRVITFGNFEVLEKVSGRTFFTPEIVPMFLRILAIILIIVSISNPRLVYTQYASNVEYVFAIDTSSSMLTPDFFPNRLEVAKKIVWDSLENLQNTKVGIVTFAGKAYVKSKLTDDLATLKEIIMNLNTETPAGTAIGEALISSATLLSNGDENKNKTIILITDGRNNVGVSLEDAVKALVTHGIRVYAIGIGKTDSLNITLPEEARELNATMAEYPTLDEESLIWISNTTNGKYFRASNVEELKKAIEESLEKKEVTINPLTYLLLAACLILLLEWSLEMTKFRIIP
ncbi:MAG TPA: VWA domain-containing protein [Candidatus Aenigmarchaeota archaeon]|nr:VWA domain-containing protein [Candidatus Aenigmarchaeota archaeon]